MKWNCMIICCAVFILGIYVGKKWSSPKTVSSSESAVLLEKMKDVFKLVFVEANFSELYSQKDYHWLDISPFRKSAIIRIQANVTAGVNMDSAKINIDDGSKTIHVQFNHQPIILYTDHTLDYYDLQQGTFNSFSSEEMTELEENAREIIHKKALESDLLIRASKKRDEMINILNQMVQSLGWKLIIEDNAPGNKIMN